MSKRKHYTCLTKQHVSIVTVIMLAHSNAGFLGGVSTGALFKDVLQLHWSCSALDAKHEDRAL